MDYIQEENNYPKAFLATGIIMLALAALCYFIVFENPPIKVDGTGGILVNYGTSEKGMGKDITSREEPAVSQKTTPTPQNKVIQEKPTEQKPQADNSTQKVVTQNTEDAAEVAANSKKKNKSIATTETAKPIKKEVLDPRASYHGPSKQGTGGGDGPDNTPGNKGSKNGSPLAPNYGNGGTGNGVTGTQWSFVSLPEVRNPSRTPGVVYINITIDANGTIVDAKADRKTRMSDLDLVNRCITAVKNSRLTSPKPGVGSQNGQVKITFDVE